MFDGKRILWFLSAIVIFMSACNNGQLSSEQSNNLASGNLPAVPELVGDTALSTESAAEWAFAFTPDQKTLYIQRGNYSKYTLYEFQWEQGGWSEAKPMDIVQEDANDTDPFITPDGSKMFFSSRRTQDGGYADPEPLPDVINTSDQEESPFIAPDESYLIFQRGLRSLYISYKEAGEWTTPDKIMLPDSSLKYSPYVTPDQKYLYYTSNERGTPDIYRVEIKDLNIRLPHSK